MMSVCPLILVASQEHYLCSWRRTCIPQISKRTPEAKIEVLHGLKVSSTNICLHSQTWCIILGVGLVLLDLTLHMQPQSTILRLCFIVPLFLNHKVRNLPAVKSVYSLLPRVLHWSYPLGAEYSCSHLQS